MRKGKALTLGSFWSWGHSSFQGDGCCNGQRQVLTLMREQGRTRWQLPGEPSQRSQTLSQDLQSVWTVKNRIARHRVWHISEKGTRKGPHLPLVRRVQ